MKKISCILFSFLIVFTMLPLQSFAANLPMDALQKSTLTESDGSVVNDETSSEGIVLGDTFVPADTQKLCISSRTRNDVDWLIAGYAIPKDCVITASVSDDDGDLTSQGYAVYDLSEITKALPNLKELYILQGKLKNSKKITDFKKLDTLYYYPFTFDESDADDINTTPFAKMKSLKKLGLFIDYQSYDFLTKMTWLKDVYAEVYGCDSKKMNEIYSCKYITNLKLKDIRDLSGIEKLTNLKILYIDSDYYIADFTPVSKLKKLEELSLITRHNTKNISSITKLEKLKALSLMDMDDEDISFIGKMTGLRRLSLSNVNTSFIKNIDKLTKLKNLYLSHIGDNGYGYGGSYDMSFLPKLKNLESLWLWENVIDIRNISRLKKLKTIYICVCKFDNLSELKKCRSLKKVSLYSNQSKFDAKWLSGSNVKDLYIQASNGVKNVVKFSKSKKLRRLTLDYTGISEKKVKKIKNALPKCRIAVYELGDKDEKVY